MRRYALLFITLLAICLALCAGMLDMFGYSLFAPQMQGILLACFLVAAYVSFRVTQVIGRRKRDLSEAPNPGGAGKSKLLGLFNSGPSAAQQAREARLKARRKKLIEEGKLEPEAAPESEPEQSDDAAPTRVSQSAPIKDRMAARAERVRKAKEDGKL